MAKIAGFFIIVLMFVSCSKEPTPIQPHTKAFMQEDVYILYALRAEQVKDNLAAAKLFGTLYEKSGKKEYLYRSLENSLVLKKYQETITKIDGYLEIQKDPALTRLKIIALFEMNKLDEASRLSVALAQETKEAKDYLLASDIYIKRQEFDLALKYLESAYARGNNEKILDKLSIVLYVNLGRKKEAIAHLETHSRILGCSELICARLIAFYSNDNNIDGLLSTYLRIYELNKNPKIAKKIVQIYSYKRDYTKLTIFLENSKSDDDTLLKIYSGQKNYKKAFPLAETLYNETSNVDYLGQSAIFEYEGAKDKNEKKLLESVVLKLEKVTRLDPQTIYLNYLGYILIDHELDVKKGMQYIDEVLKTEPNSAFYLDSKAWGYYKLGQCKKAKKLMDRVVTLEGGDDEEVKSHVAEIEKCINK